MRTHLRLTAEKLGLAFGDRRMSFNSRRAQELGKWAEAQGRGEAFHRAVFQAYFSDGLNIAHVPVLKTVAAAAGLRGDDIEAVLTRGDFSESVDRDWARSHAMGVNAVPTFVINGRRLVGAQTYAALAGLVQPFYA
jgi:predicted DsbA family dithiol-disulfide isomerase